MTVEYVDRDTGDCLGTSKTPPPSKFDDDVYIGGKHYRVHSREWWIASEKPSDDSIVVYLREVK